MTGPGVVSRLLAARALRGFGDGFISLLLPVYLLHLGLRPLEVGIVATATLLGSGLLTLGVGLYPQLQRRTVLLAASALMVCTGFGLASVQGFWPLLLIAFVGTVNPSGGDVSVFLPMEHATLAEDTPPARRTAVFARYSLAGTLAGAVGALTAGLPQTIGRALGVADGTVLSAAFAFYGVLGFAVAAIYRGLPRRAHAASAPRPAASALGPSRRRIYLLAGLFSLDAFGSGFFVQSLLALWLFQRFGLSVEAAGTLFFWSGVLTAVSYLVAARLAGRIGLVQTMVYTHIPANVCIIAIPFCDSLPVAIALLMVRGLLSQMDVPTRSSYVMAIVQPEERAAAASVTTVPRSFAAALSPALAGWMLTASPFGWPLILGGALKIVYDLLLLAMFEKVKPPEEDKAGT